MYSEATIMTSLKKSAKHDLFAVNAAVWHWLSRISTERTSRQAVTMDDGLADISFDRATVRVVCQELAEEEQKACGVLDISR